MTETAIVSEVDRYLADPGQALAYNVGELELQRIRNEAERTLGSRFNFRTFQAEVLRHGALPLGGLDSLVQEWV